MQKETMLVLVALAKECRYELHNCNQLLREIVEYEAKPSLTSEQEQDLKEARICYLSAQERYVALLNALESCKQAVGRTRL